MTRQILSYGSAALLVECADGAEARSLAAALARRAEDQIEEIVPGARTVLVRPIGRPSRDLINFLTEGPLDPSELDHGPVIDIGVHYDGDDLDRVAELTGLSRDEVIMIHTGQLWTVAFCGFAPGFGYLVGENDRLRVPRRERPRTTVPAGAVALADAYCGVYPRSTPGGWQLVGRTEETLWDLDHDPPALLRPGTRVRFRALR